MAAVSSMMMMRAPAALNYGAVQRKSTLGSQPISRLPHKCSRSVVKCMAKYPKESSSTSTSTKFSDLFAFSGPVPEIINGRAAMLGFVSAIGVELASGRDLLSQLNSGGVSWFLITAGLLTVASVVSLFKGIPAESKSQPIFSSSAEMLNGHLGMLGLVALKLTEYGHLGSVHSGIIPSYSNMGFGGIGVALFSMS